MLKLSKRFLVSSKKMNASMILQFYIMKICIELSVIVIFSILAQNTCQSASLSIETQTIYPYILQYIDEFTISSNDLQNLLANQFRQITISNINTSSYEVNSNAISLSYVGTSKNVEQLTPLKVSVTNDSFTLTDQFTIRVLHAAGGTNYSCSTKIAQILVTYVKEVDFTSGNTLITNLNSTFSSKSFSQAVCKGSVAAKDKSSIANAVNSSQNASIYLELKKTFDKMQYYLSANAKEEHLSKIYNQNPYTYDFYGFKIDINVSTIEANPFGQKGIQNQISGTIEGTSTPALSSPDYEQNYSTFISLQFIKNMIEYSKNNYGGWKNIRLTRNNMRTNVFKFRLLDFEYITPNVLKQYPEKYLSDVEIQCSVDQIKDLTIDETYLTQDIDWRCLGSFEQELNKRVVFINFLVGLKHVAQILLQPSYMSVRVDDVKLRTLEFDYIDTYEVIDPFTASQFINECLFEFRVFTIGTFFKTNSPNKMKNQIPERGVWIG